MGCISSKAVTANEYPITATNEFTVTGKYVFEISNLIFLTLLTDHNMGIPKLDTPKNKIDKLNLRSARKVYCIIV